MSDQPSIAGVRIWALPPGVPLRIDVEPASAPGAPAHAARVDAAWADLRRANPRLYDGPILSVVAFAPQQAHVVCRRESYKWLAVQDTVPTGVHQLGVSGAITVRDHDGRECVLLGRRSPATRTHGGLWELAPSGGLDPPPGAGPCTLGPADILAALAAESREELGMTLDWSSADLVAIYRDDLAHNDDVVACLRLADPLDPANPPRTLSAWEYTEICWLPIDEAADFDARDAASVRPPTRALLRHFGWVRS